MHDKQTEALIAQIAEVMKDAKPVKLSPATMCQIKALGRLVSSTTRITDSEVWEPLLYES